jgi:hypothetical protein
LGIKENENGHRLTALLVAVVQSHLIILVIMIVIQVQLRRSYENVKNLIYYYILYYYIIN